MLNLITVEVVCPALSRSYDFMLPPGLDAETIRSFITENIRTYEEVPQLFAGGDTKLFSAGRCISGKVTLAEYGIKNGDKIYIL